ncbi:UNVERIFIED_ORG: transposase [Peribacillus simplex]
MRKTIEEVETNMAYRWLLGYGFHDNVPHFSTFGENYERRLKDTDLFEQIFYRILMTASERKLSLFHRIDLIKKKPKELKKVQLTLRVATMQKMNEQNSLPIHFMRLQTATVLCWGRRFSVD